MCAMYMSFGFKQINYLLNYCVVYPLLTAIWYEFVRNLVDTVSTGSGIYHTSCSSTVGDAVAVRFYGQQCQPSGGCAWSACPPQNHDKLDLIAGGRPGGYNLY